MRSVIVTAAAGAALLLAGCAQQEEPAPVRPEPMLDKFGGGTCTEGFIYVPGSVPERAGHERWVVLRRVDTGESPGDE